MYKYTRSGGHRYLDRCTNVPGHASGAQLYKCPGAYVQMGRYSRRQKKPYTFCAAGTLHNYGRYTLVKRIYNFVVGKRIIKNASRCIAITQLEGKDFLDYGVAEKKINIIPNEHLN